jgi:hypothetical protein
MGRTGEVLRQLLATPIARDEDEVPEVYGKGAAG